MSSPDSIKIAVYGGAFNPPHAGHARVIEEASRMAERVMVVPSFMHPFGKVMAEFEIRFRLLSRVIQSISKGSRNNLEVSDIERRLSEMLDGPVYSYTLLRHIAAMNGFDEARRKQIAFVVGPDVLSALPGYHLGEALLNEFSVITVDETVRSRSSVVRKMMRDSLPIPGDWVAPGLVVSDYNGFEDLEVAHG